MSEFDKLLNIFKCDGPSKLSPKNNINNKRKSLPKLNGSGVSAQNSEIKRKRSNQDLVKLLGERSAIKRTISERMLFQDQEEEADESTDKDEILPHLSCIVSDFKNAGATESNIQEEDNESRHLTDTQHMLTNSKLDKFKPSDFSPDIEDCSQFDYFKSQETMRIRDINNQLENLIQKQLKKMKLPTNCGNLTKNFLQAKLDKFEKWLKFLNNQSKGDELEKFRKIQIINYETQFSNLIVQFQFVDTIDSDHDHETRCLTLPLLFEKILAKHKMFEVVFYANEPLEVESNCWYLSVKHIKAIRSQSIVTH